MKKRMKSLEKSRKAAMILTFLLMFAMLVPETASAGMVGKVISDYAPVSSSYYASGDIYTVKVDSGYLALRTAMAFDQKNEIGSLYTGENVVVINRTSKDYWYVYSYKLGKYGYVNCNYLVFQSSGGYVGGDVYTAKVDSGYLALRTAMAFDSKNEIGPIYTGETVIVLERTSSDYWYVYAPTLNKYGYVNCKYLSYSSSMAMPTCDQYTVKVASGYLALRTAMAFDSKNEIGSLYTGETVTVLERTTSDYWYVYAPSLNKYGYVNCDYLVYKSAGSGYSGGGSYTVKVDSGYLALRTAMAFDYSNEIGHLYTGEKVELIEKSSSDYWYVYVPSLKKYGYVNRKYLY